MHGYPSTKTKKLKSSVYVTIKNRPHTSFLDISIFSKKWGFLNSVVTENLF